MVRMNARLIPTTEKTGLATPLWSDSEFKTLLGEQMDLIVTEKVRQKLTLDLLFKLTLQKRRNMRFIQTRLGR